MLGAAALGACLVFKFINRLISEKPVVGHCPLKKPRFFAVNFVRIC